jgi:FAD:protein FMN transferase
LVSVTVLHAECMVADALATAFTVMGVKAALAYAKQKDIAALFIEHKLDSFEEHLSPKLMAMLE